jgi:hypothetical protein
MTELTGDFVALGGPSVTILDVPALRCDSCGAFRLAEHVLGRLSIIVEKAVRHGQRHGLAGVRWSFTPSGPPEIGGMPSDVRDSFAALRELIAHERRKVEMIKRLGRETPRWFH